MSFRGDARLLTGPPHAGCLPLPPTPHPRGTRRHLRERHHSHSRRVLALHLDAVALVALERQEIQLGARMRGPEIRLIGSREPQHLLDRVPLP